MFIFSIKLTIICVLMLRNAVSSLQKAGGIYSLVALSPSVGSYASGRFRSNVPMRVVQPITQTNNSVDLDTADHCEPAIKLAAESRKRKRQAVLPCLTMSYEVIVGAWEGKMRVTVCWRELLYDDDTGGRWVYDNLLF
jgi:hypothetical protein